MFSISLFVWTGTRRAGQKMNNNKLKVFSDRARMPLARKITYVLDDHPGLISLTRFPDVETQVKIEYLHS
jgi:phosphoribosylpyrophosphate synthetase